RGGMGMAIRSGGKAFGGLGAVVVLVQVVGLRVFRMAASGVENDRADRAVAKDVAGVLGHAKDFRAEHAYYEKLVTTLHPEAFTHACHYGTRFSSSHFDDEKYVNEFFAKAIAQAQRDGKTGVATELASLQQNFYGLVEGWPFPHRG